uniref:R3H domain-containing protein n=1 Tax=Trichobilharzia regenti TaxID=157069 RepID=A0AA85IKE1_TRIRE|nr:unnamed protein product [Trichobilharzia regenti]
MNYDNRNNEQLPSSNRFNSRTGGTFRRGSRYSVVNYYNNRSDYYNRYRTNGRRGRPFRTNSRCISNRGSSTSFVGDSNSRSHPVAESVPQSTTSIDHFEGSVFPAHDGSSDSDNSSSITKISISAPMLPTGTKFQDNLRNNLIDGLRNSTYECMICISKIRIKDSVWSCATCYHIYHLSCIKSWAKSQVNSAVSTPTPCWHCPSCQTDYETPFYLLFYQCFCGRTRNPEFHPARNTVPHGCDQLCNKVKRLLSAHNLPSNSVADYRCPHRCTELCHPGPCPPCLHSVTLSCPCGKFQRSGICGDPSPPPCGQICGRQLPSSLCAAGVHVCLERCHYGPCSPCRWKIQTTCFCGQVERKLMCNSREAKQCIFSHEDLEILRAAAVELQKSMDFTKLTDMMKRSCIPLGDDIIDNDSSVTEQWVDVQVFPPDALLAKLGSTFSCHQPCNSLLNCNFHKCTNYCHSGKCPPCLLDPKWCLNCPCGKTPLSKLVSSGSLYGDRKSCTDPLPTCPNVCERRQLLCDHPCPEYCHVGSCPPCKLSISLKCRCGHTSKTLTCDEFSKLTETQDGISEFTCERMCKKRLTCGRHKCKAKCCNDTVHSCSEVCGHRLSCQIHYCEEQCHSGPCNSCWRGVIYSELVCRCGYTVLHPPQPCGTTGPECNQPCNRMHNCDHPVRHTCHNEPTCPPCTILVTKDCPGGHGIKFNVPCFQEIQSCGRTCNKPLPGCSHSCQRKCHAGPCLDSTDSSALCTQLCQKPRPGCGHPCGLPCHEVDKLSCMEAANNCSSKTQLLCSALVDVVCPCGKRKESQYCHEVYTKQFLLFEHKQSVSEESTIIRPLHANDSSMKSIPLLACNDQCIDHPKSDVTGRYADTSTWKRGFVNNCDIVPSNSEQDAPFDPPDYPQHLKEFALRNLVFVENIEKQLKSMVLEFLKSNVEEVTWKNRTDHPRVVNHYFPPMNKKKRRFICDIVEFYGMEASVCGIDPNRHVMVIARRGYSKLPGGAIDNRGSLINTLKREYAGTIKFPDKQKTLDKNATRECHILPNSNISTISYAQILSGKHSE